MEEVLYTGQVPIKIPATLSPTANLHQAPLSSSEFLILIIKISERQDLLRFIHFDLATRFIDYTSGRIFDEHAELRWEQQGNRMQVVYLGSSERVQTLLNYKLQKSDVLNQLKPGIEKKYSLFGERIAPADLKKIGGAARQGDFAEVRIPRLLRYPQLQDEQRYVRLVVREYLNEENRVALFRSRPAIVEFVTMNPYDFARIDWKRPPERHPPIWHHRLTGQGIQRLFSGHLNVDVYAETPLFISDPRSISPDPRRPAQSLQNQRAEYIIPGSSLKGVLRLLVETLGNGCLTLFDGDYESYRVHYRDRVPPQFRRCADATNLCIACRTFGMLNRGDIFLGKVNVGDAVSYPGKAYQYDPIYTAVLVEPKPRHQAFYLDEQGQHIAGRKFYFHHSSNNLLTERQLRYFGRNQEPANRYIQPLDQESSFHFRVDFTNLEAGEFGALLIAVTLEDEMRHKLGYGKPIGLGSVQFAPTSLTLVDYAVRYTSYSQPGVKGGKTTWEGDPMWNEVLFEQTDTFIETELSRLAMDDLRRIWRWPPDPDVDYYYPSKRDWFDTPASRSKRIADTRDVP